MATDRMTWLAASLSAAQRADAHSRVFAPDRAANELLGYCGQPTVAACAAMNADACASQTLRLYRRVRSSRKPIGRMQRRKLESGDLGAKSADWASWGGDIEEVTTHPAIDLLARPNPQESGYQYARSLFWDLEVFGKTYEFVGSGGADRVSELRRLAPQNTMYRPNADGHVTSVLYGRDPARIAEFAAEYVSLYRYAVHPDDPWDGISWLRSVTKEVRVLLLASAYDIGFLDNAQMPHFVVTVPPETSDEQIRRVYDEIESRARGAEKSGQPLVVRAATITPLAASGRDVQALEKLERAERVIRTAAGVPESMADINQANLASASVGYDRQYLAGAIRPRVQAMADLRNEFYLPLFGLGTPDYWLAYDDPVPGDVAAKTTQAIAQTQAGLITINEARRELGYDDAEGGDVLRFGGRSLDSIDAPPPPAFGALPGLGLSTPPGGADDTTPLIEAAQAEEAAQATTEPKGGEQAAAKSAACDPWADPACGCAHKWAAKSGGKQRPDMDLAAILADVYADALEAARNGSVVLVGDFAAQIETVLMPVFQEILLDSILTASGKDGAGVGLDVYSDFAARYAREYVPELAGQVAESATSAIQEAIDTGIREGKSATEVADDLEAAGFSADRADRIARTETARAQSMGRVAHGESLGHATKTWLLANDACPLCSGLVQAVAQVHPDGRVPIGEPFAAAGDTVLGTDGSAYVVRSTIMSPPLHPYCRCDIVTAPADDSDE